MSIVSIECLIQVNRRKGRFDIARETQSYKIPDRDLSVVSAFLSAQSILLFTRFISTLNRII